MDSGLKAIDRVTAHFEGLGRKKITIDEWDLDIYLKPLTVKSFRGGLFAKVQSGNVDAMIDLVVNISLNEDGDAIFNNGDKTALKNKCPLDILVRISDAASEFQADKEAEKN